jgi:hypothetical protein
MKKTLISLLVVAGLSFLTSATFAESYKYVVPAGTVYTTSEKLVSEDIENVKEFAKSLQSGLTQKEILEKLYLSNTKVLKKYKPNEVGILEEPTLLETVEPKCVRPWGFTFNQKEIIPAYWVKMRYKSQVIWVFIEMSAKK